MTLSFDVIVVGSYTIDLIFSGLTEFPQLGADVRSSQFNMTPGEAYIPAVQMHRLGIKVGWAADFGNDELSLLALKFVREEGLDESLFVFHNRPYRRLSVAASNPVDRGFLTYYDPDPPILAAIPALMKAQAKVLLIPGLISGTKLDIGMKLVRAKKMKLFMDGNSTTGDICGKTRECAAIRKAIKNADIFIPNAQEARRITGAAQLAEAMQKLGELCPLVVVKDGSNGSYAYTEGAIIHVPGIPVSPMDTTGAGDSFNAGFMRAWLDGQSIEACLKWGNITGGLSTTALGGTARKITLTEVKNVMSNAYP